MQEVLNGLPYIDEDKEEKGDKTSYLGKQALIYLQNVWPRYDGDPPIADKDRSPIITKIRVGGFRIMRSILGGSLTKPPHCCGYRASQGVESPF